MKAITGGLMGLATAAILLVVVFLVISQTQTQIIAQDGVNVSDASTFSTAYNASRTTQSAVATVPGWLPLIILVMIGAGLIYMVKRFGGGAM